MTKNCTELCAIGKPARETRKRTELQALLKRYNPTQKAHKVGTVKSPDSRGDGKDNLEPEIFRFSQGGLEGLWSLVPVQVLGYTR